MKHILILITALYILLSVQGCAKPVTGAEYDEWQWMAGTLYMQNPGDKVCMHRCAIIAKAMMEKGVAFDLVFGSAAWSNKGHVRIEYWRDGDLIILEPMWSDNQISKFIEEDRWAYVPGADANIRVISFVNRVLASIGEEPYERND